MHCTFHCTFHCIFHQNTPTHTQVSWRVRRCRSLPRKRRRGKRGTGKILHPSLAVKIHIASAASCLLCTCLSARACLHTHNLCFSAHVRSCKSSCCAPACLSARTHNLCLLAAHVYLLCLQLQVLRFRRAASCCAPAYAVCACMATICVCLLRTFTYCVCSCKSCGFAHRCHGNGRFARGFTGLAEDGHLAVSGAYLPACLPLAHTKHTQRVYANLVHHEFPLTLTQPDPASQSQTSSPESGAEQVMPIT